MLVYFIIINWMNVLIYGRLYVIWFFIEFEKDV